MSIQLLGRAALLGFASGGRAGTPLAAESLLAARGRLSAEGRLGSLMSRKLVSCVFTAAGAGELIADKLPFMPDRRNAGSVLVRATSGAICGAVLFSSEHANAALGAAVGAAAAVSGTYILFAARRALTSNRLPDPIVAVCEDAFLIGLSAAALRVSPSMRVSQ